MTKVSEQFVSARAGAPAVVEPGQTLSVCPSTLLADSKACQAYSGRELPQAFWVPSGMLKNPHHSQEQCTQKELGPLNSLERAGFTDIHEASLKAKSKQSKLED